MVKLKNVGGETPTNGAKHNIEISLPYQVFVTVQGNSDFLFHRWNCEEVESKSALAKGSKGKKMDNIESFVYRDEENNLCIPSEYFRMSIVNAAKYKQDPRSTRKSAMDLYKAGICCLNPLCSLGKETWDYEDKRRVVIQRNGINRIRPAMREGWQTVFNLMVNIPEYITPKDLNEIIQLAGRLVGVGDFRPTFGRFNIVNFSAVQEVEAA